MAAGRIAQSARLNDVFQGILASVSDSKQLFTALLTRTYCLLSYRKTIDAVLQEGDDGEIENSDFSQHPSSSSDPTISQDPHGAGAPTNHANNKKNGEPRPGEDGAASASSEDELKRVEYSVLLSQLKAKDYERALKAMESDAEEFGRFLKQAKESHLVDPWDVLCFIIRAKFFECVKTNNKHASAIYAILYTALEMDVSEALHFLVLHTTTEFDASCRSLVASITASPLSSGSGQSSNDPSNSAQEDGQGDRPASVSGGDMAAVNGLSKMFESISKIMSEYAYVESFGLKRTLMLLRAAQPILEKHALALLNHWLRTSRFDDYALSIPGNDWNKYEDYQLSKLSEKATANLDVSNPRPSNASEVPAVRVGGKVDPMNVLLSLEQFSAISQLTESYKGYIHRIYEKGIEEMKEKGHTFVDLGDDSNSSHPSSAHMPHNLASGDPTVHNIRTYVAEPAQLFFFVARKGESYKQLESWHLGTSLLAAFGSQDADAKPKSAQGAESSGSTAPPRPKEDLKDPSAMIAAPSAIRPGTPGTAEMESSSPAVVPPSPSPASIFSSQKIDHVFALLMRSMERSIASRQCDVSHTLLRRAVALCPSFLYSLLLRRFNSALPKIHASQQNDIAALIFDFHGELQDDAFLASRTPQRQTPVAAAQPAKPTASPTAPASSGPKSVTSFLSSGLGGLMNLVGTNASGAMSSAATGITSADFGLSESFLVQPPILNIWYKADLTRLCAALNDIALCPKYFGKLQDDLERKVRFFEKGEENRKLLLGDLGHLKTTLPSVFVADSSLQALLLCITPGLAYHLHQFWKTSYEMGEEQFKAAEINDPWASAACHWLKASITPFHSTIQPELTESLVGNLAGLIASQLERLLLRKRISAFGALALDSHIRTVLAMLNSLLPSMSSFVARRKFAVLKEIVTILCLASESEMLELWNASHEDQSQYFDPSLAQIDPGHVVKSKAEWHLTPERVKAYMKCRSEWKPQIIDGLHLS